MVSEVVARNFVWGFAITMLVLGILAALGGLMAIPTVGIDQGVAAFLISGFGGMYLGGRIIKGLRLSKKHDISIS